MQHPDPSFPRLHGRPSQGWLNDPHGCIRVDGRYHVFFQHNPDRPHHTQIKWGHMSSTDLAHWDDEPLALFNRPGEFDEHGCWTGSIIDDNGTPTAIYSAVANAGARAVVMLARSDRRLRRWRQDRRPVHGWPRDPAVTHARDPFVFEFDGHRYAIQGAGNADHRGAARVLVYACDDITKWTELGPLVSAHDDPLAAALAPADIWECPNLVRFGDRWILIVSLLSVLEGTSVATDVRYLIGDLELTGEVPRFRTTGGGSLDRGPCFYAPQVLRENDRTLIWGWAQERRPQAEIDDAGWAGTLTFAREFQLVNDVVACSPAPELALLRAQPLELESCVPFTAAAFDIERPPPASGASLWLLDATEERLVADISIPSAPLTPPRILVDGSIVEIFDGSPTPFTTRAYPTATSTWMLRLQRPAPVSAWVLGP
jgi:beta-fructofuranosidase